MTPEEWAHMLRLAAGVFGDNRLVDDPDAASVWYASLKRFPGRVVFAAFTKLAETADRFPALAQVIEGCRLELDRLHREEVKQQLHVVDQQRLEAPALATADGVGGAIRASFAEAAENARVAARRDGASDQEVEEAVEQVRRRWSAMSPSFASVLGVQPPQPAPTADRTVHRRRLVPEPYEPWTRAGCGCMVSITRVLGHAIEQICPYHRFWFDLHSGRKPWEGDRPQAYAEGSPQWQRAREQAHTWMGLPAPAAAIPAAQPA